MMGHYEETGNQTRAGYVGDSESDVSGARIGSQIAYMNDQLSKVLALFSELENRLDLVMIPEQSDPSNSIMMSGPPKKLASQLSYNIDELNSQIQHLQYRIGNVIERVQL